MTAGLTWTVGLTHPPAYRHWWPMATMTIIKPSLWNMMEDWNPCNPMLPCLLSDQRFTLLTFCQHCFQTKLLFDHQRGALKLHACIDRNQGRRLQHLTDNSMSLPWHAGDPLPSTAASKLLKIIVWRSPEIGFIHSDGAPGLSCGSRVFRIPGDD